MDARVELALANEVIHEVDDPELAGEFWLVVAIRDVNTVASVNRIAQKNVPVGALYATVSLHQIEPNCPSLLESLSTKTP
jgi:hypothetical protein